MTSVKHVLSFFLFLVGFWITVELYQLHLQNIGDFAGIAAYTEESEGVEGFLQNLTEKMQASQVNFFYLRNQYDAKGREVVHVFCDENVRTELEKKYWIKAGEVFGLIGGNTRVIFDSVGEMNPKSFCRGEYYCYLVGDTEQVESFLFEWNESGETVLNTNGVTTKTVKVYLCFLWVVICCIIGSMTVFERMLQRKEFFVRISLGETINKEALRHIGVDGLFYGLELIVAFCVVKSICGAVCFAECGIFVFFIVFGISIVTYGRMIKNDFRYAFSNALMSEETLVFGYFMVIIFSTIFFVSIFWTGKAVDDYLKISNQKAFYQQFKGYYRVSFEPFKSDIIEYMSQPEEKTDPFEYSHSVCRRFYEEQFQNCSVCVFAPYVREGDTSVIFANYHMKEYLEKLVGREIAEEGIVYGFYPEAYSEDVVKAGQYERFLYDNEGKEIVWEPYHQRVSTAVTGYLQEEFCLYTNPIIVFDSMTEFAQDAWKDKESVPYSGMYYVKCPEQTIVDYADANAVNPRYEDVYSFYFSRYRRLMKKAIFFVSCDGILLVMISILLHIIVKMECTVNSVELAIKKTMGISRYGRYRRLYMTPLGTSLFGLLGLLYMSNRMEIDITAKGILVVLGTIVLQMLIITFNIERIEKYSVQRALKKG